MKKNYSHLADELLEKVSRIDNKYKIFPMFGTLLSLYRDKGVKRADDYDFASFNPEIISKEFILKIEAIGLKFYKFAFIGNKCTEVCFKYKNVTVDFFLLSNEGNYTVHNCHNFRTSSPQERKKIKFLNGIRFKTYSEFFIVKYEKINLKTSNELKLLIPSDNNCENIFTNHYGDDWRTPKESNFIDFKKYNFLREFCGTVHTKKWGYRKFKKIFFNFIENKDFPRRYQKVVTKKIGL